MNVASSNCLDQRRKIVDLRSGKTFIRDGSRINKPPFSRETANADAVCTLLHTGTVFPPDTLFSDFAAVGLGGRLEVSDSNSIVYEETSDLFDGVRSDVDDDLDPIHLLAEELDHSDVDFSNAVLLLSEGKDSIAIAIALAELGVSVDCVTFANSDTHVEWVRRIAQSLNHRHDVVTYGSLTITDNHLASLSHVFEPSTDQAFVSYLTMTTEVLQDRVIIDGMGNDIYMGHIPSRNQYYATYVSDIIRRLMTSGAASWMSDHSFIGTAIAGLPFRTFSECQGLYNGFNRSHLERCVGGRVKSSSTDVDRMWRTVGFERARALTRGRYLDTYSFMGKTIALAEMAGGKAYFPWASTRLAGYYASIADDKRFDWNHAINKLPLRKALADRINYDQPKVGFRAPVEAIIHENKSLMRKAISSSAMLGADWDAILERPRPEDNRVMALVLFALWEQSNR